MIASLPEVSFPAPRTGPVSGAGVLLSPTVVATASLMHAQPSGSSRRAYLEWVEEQVEDFKESISRSELLQLADEVVRELMVSPRGQYQLTELLLSEAVDRRIIRMLGLPSYRVWAAARADAPPPGEDAEDVSL